jgi:predicted GNAT family acetyltransferase
MRQEIRLLDQSDFNALDDFLRPKTAEAYFIRSNAKRGGLVYEGRPFQAQYLASFDDGKINGVVSYTWMNAFISYASDPTALSALTQATVPLIKERNGSIGGFLGLAEQIESVVVQLGISNASFRRDEAESLYLLNLDEMRLPELLKSPDYFVRRAKEDDLKQVISWRVSYDIEVLNAASGPELEERVRKDVIQRMRLGELFVLEKNGEILSLCGVVGGVPEAIMIAPLWTPHKLREKGYGKAVTAGAIQFLANTNLALRQAVLYTANPAAACVYEYVGFKRIANWRLALLKEGFRLGSSQNFPEILG